MADESQNQQVPADSSITDTASNATGESITYTSTATGDQSGETRTYTKTKTDSNNKSKASVNASTKSDVSI